MSVTGAPKCEHGYSTYTDDGGTVHIATGGRCSAVPVPPDPARDRRVAARRAEDARKAGAGLDRLLHDPTPHETYAYHAGYMDGYLAAGLHHNRHYAVPRDASTASVCRNQDHEHFPRDPVLPSCVYEDES